jgi:hypothetical protein
MATRERSQSTEPHWHAVKGEDVERRATAAGTERRFMLGFNNLTKAFLGAASFELPWALKQSGVWAGAVSLCLFGLICGYTLKARACACPCSIAHPELYSSVAAPRALQALH